MVKLECPICEHVFEVSGPLVTELTCPECHRGFVTASAVVDSDEPTLPAPVEELPSSAPVKAGLTVPEPEQARELRSNTEPQKSDSPNQTVAPTAPPQHNELNESVLSTSRPAPPKKPGKVLPLVGLMVLAMIAGALLVYLPMVLSGNAGLASNEPSTALDGDQVNQTSDLDEPNPSDSELDPATIDDADTKPISTGDIDAGEVLGDEVEPPAPLSEEEQRKKKRFEESKPAPPGKRSHFSEKQFADFWRENQNRIVRLEITNSLGKQHALGTIVDSRGWVATSFRAVAGASKVRVIQTMGSFESFRSEEPLRDSCQGVIASDPAHDIVLLAINTRFVFINSELEIAKNDEIMGTDHLIQFALFEDNMPIALRETQSLERAVHSGLNEDNQAFFQNSFLNSEDLRWIQHVNTEGTVPGAPLFTPDGQLVGINSINPADDRSFAVPTTHLVQLIDDIPFDVATDGGRNPQALEVLDRDLEKVGMELRDKQMTVDEASPVREASVALNLAGKKCEDFRFAPKNETDYTTLQDFARQMLELTFYTIELATNEDDPNYHRELADKEKLQLQIKTWQDRLLKNLYQKPLRTPESIKTLNQLATEKVNQISLESGDNPYQVSFLRLNLTAIDSPRINDGTATITMEVDGTGRMLSIPFDERLPAMLPETVWLAIYVIDSDGEITFKHPQTKRSTKARQGQILMIQGPLD